VIIQHNIAAMMTNRQLGINNKKISKSAERLASGFKINRAADNAAGLTISEKMRMQIRGLERATANAEDGVNFIQTADGVMGEISSILHRMRELTVSALNDSNTLEDKATIALEIEELQSEIDAMCSQTEFNSQNVFEAHEDTYYSIKGSKQWDPMQFHIVEEPHNDLIIYLPEDYEPSTYSIKVSKGNYTTQELVDEIDTALEQMTPPNPGFVLEFTKDGYCNLNFEGGEEIKSVEGALSGLIYGRNNGSEYGKLVGTTQFEAGWPLHIVSGRNDTVTFYTEDLNGSESKKITLTIPAGYYGREAMIDKLNQALEAQNLEGVIAKEYGDKSIQLSAGQNVVTGLKGNMFAIDDDNSYSSVFYDNVKSGKSTQTAAYFEGRAYYRDGSKTNKLKITSSNNKLRLKVDDGDFQEITIEEADYTIESLAKELNEKFQEADIQVTASTSLRYVYVEGAGSGNYDFLVITSNSKGNNSTLLFDDYSNDIYKDTYDTLFRKTSVSYTEEAFIRSSTTIPSLTGRKDLKGPINLPADAKTLNLNVEGDNYTLTLSESNYSSLDELITDLNMQINDLAGIKDRIKVGKLDDQIRFFATDNSVDYIYFKSGDKGSAYEELFTEQYENTNYFSQTSYGEEETIQGNTKPTIFTPAKINLGHKLSGTNIVNDNNNIFNIRVNGTGRAIKLTNGTYSPSQLVSEINKQFKLNKIEVTASLENGALTFTTNVKGEGTSLHISRSYSGSAMKLFVGTTKGRYTEIIGLGEVAYVDGVSQSFPLTIDESNHDFHFSYMENGVKEDVDISLAQKEYDTYSDLQQELQTAIDNKLGSGKLLVTVNSNGVRIETTGKIGGIVFNEFSGGFYKNIMCKDKSIMEDRGPTYIKGKHTFKEAFVVGRKDIRNSTVEIIRHANDKFIMDLTYPDPEDDLILKELELSVTIEAGEYTGDDLAMYLEEKLNQQLSDAGIDNVQIKVAIGGINSGVAGADDDNAINFSLVEAEGKEADHGSYTLDGVRGSSAYTIFYKTIGTPEPSYIQGSKDISDGVEITEETNIFQFTTDGKDYKYTLNPGIYTADELVETLNQMFVGGDDNGQVVPLQAKLENGRLKIQHQVFGPRSIDHIDGTAKGIIFYEEVGREDLEDLYLQVSDQAGDAFTLDRIILNTSVMKINSITVSKNKYAEKALGRLDYALNYLSKKRGLYGAKQNALGHIISSNLNRGENTQAAESRIRDADIAKEMMEYSKNNILAQASQAMLAQANHTPQNILNLLLNK